MPEFAPVTKQFLPSILVSISSGLNFFECSLQSKKIHQTVGNVSIEDLNELTFSNLYSYIKHWDLKHDRGDHNRNHNNFIHRD